MDDFEVKLQSRAEARVGTVLRGKWRIQRLLGVGGMATVFEATHRNGKRGAVKMLHRELCVDPGLRSRFLREGYVANQVDHPGSVSVLDDDIDEDGSVFLVMELLEGESLDVLVRQRPEGKLEVGEVLDVADDVLDVLALAHDKGIVHRDLKPENLFATVRGDLKVLDFGIARMRDGTGGTSRRTKQGSQMGTPAFMPPEQALGNWDAVNAQSDIWAVGATLFTLLSGRVVHQGGNVNQVLLAAMTQPAPKLTTIAPEVPSGVATLIDRALAQEPSERWPDARAMQAEVRQLRTLLRLSDVSLRAPARPAMPSAPLEVPGAPTVQDSSPPEEVDPSVPAAPALTPEGVSVSRIASSADRPREVSMERDHPSTERDGSSPSTAERAVSNPDSAELPHRTVPGLTTDPTAAQEGSKRRFAVGALFAGALLVGGVTATLVFGGRGGAPTEPLEPSAVAAPATTSSTGPAVEPGEPLPAGSGDVPPETSAAASAKTAAPPANGARSANKPAGTAPAPGPGGDPFGRWR